MFGAQFIGHGFGYLPLRGLNVALFASEDHHEIFLVIIIEHLVYPEVDTVEALLVCQVVADYCRRGIPIVEGDHRAEALGAPCVPNVELHLSAISESDSLL